MAFGSKKSDSKPAAEELAEAQAGLDLEAPAGDPEDASNDGSLNTEAPAAPVVQATAPADDLLGMFQASQVQAEDYSSLLSLAPGVELDDLLEELHTVAAALGCGEAVRAYALAA